MPATSFSNADVSIAATISVNWFTVAKAFLISLEARLTPDTSVSSRTLLTLDTDFAIAVLLAAEIVTFCAVAASSITPSITVASDKSTRAPAVFRVVASDFTDCVNDAELSPVNLAVVLMTLAIC